jgi:dCTP deaminase
LGEKLLVFDQMHEVDVREQPKMLTIEMPRHGYWLESGRLYLGVTEEWTKTVDFVPEIDGKSSLGRLGVGVHVTAGRGDAGFEGYWTLEITVTQRTKVYPGMPIGQLTYHTIEGRVLRPYGSRPGSKYMNQRGEPVPSQMWKNFT